MRPEINDALRSIWCNISGLMEAEVESEIGITPELTEALAGAHVELDKLFGGK